MSSESSDSQPSKKTEGQRVTTKADRAEGTTGKSRLEMRTNRTPTQRSNGPSTFQDRATLQGRTEANHLLQQGRKEKQSSHTHYLFSQE